MPLNPGAGNCCVTFSDPGNPSTLEREIAMAGNNCCVKIGPKRSAADKKMIVLGLLTTLFVMGLFLTIILVAMLKRDARYWEAKSHGH